MNDSNNWKENIFSDKRAFICIGILLFSSFIALFAYLIIPDNTENANRQIPQIALSRPGYTQNFFLKEKNIDIPNRSLFEILINGRRDRLDFEPFDSISIENEVVVTVYKTVIKYHTTRMNEEIIRVQKTFLFGTDKFGRDVLSRIILGLRISLIIGFLSVILSLFLGITIGSISGYYGGRVDKIILLIINTSWSIPTVLMAFAVIIALGKGFMVIILAIGLTMWVDVARLVRGQVIQIKNELYVKASKILGFNDFRIISTHILPNIIGPILVMAAANFATAILVEAGLSYLGLGIQPPTPSLGNMLQESYAYATGGFVYLALFPILTIMTLVLSFNLLGTALRDIFDIK